MENNSTAVSANNMAFMPRLHTIFPQNLHRSSSTLFFWNVGCKDLRGISVSIPDCVADVG